MKPKISYEETQKHHSLMNYCHSQSEKAGLDGEKNMTEINWNSALAGSGKYVRLEEGQRITLVAKNPRFEEVEKEFKGQEPKLMPQLTLDVIEEEGVACEKEISTLSKRFMVGLRPLFEGVDAETPVKFSVKKIGTGTDTNYDVEAL